MTFEWLLFTVIAAVLVAVVVERASLTVQRVFEAKYRVMQAEQDHENDA